jgi:hypothetical protein
MNEIPWNITQYFKVFITYILCNIMYI